MARAEYSVSDKVALVTGAARGIGAAVARGLASRGAYVSLVGSEPEQLERLADDLGERAMWVEADVSDRDAIEAAATQTAERFGGIDIVIANAGIGSAGSVRLVDPDAFDRVIEVNFMGVWRTVRACLPHVVQRRGYILNVASVAAVIHPPGMASYTASKAAVEAFSDALRAEVGHLGVDVGVAYFSWLDTDLVRASEERAAGRAARTRLKGAAGRTYPVSLAVDAVMRGIAERDSVVVAPRWVRALLPARGVLGRVIGRAAARHFPEIEAMAEAEIRLEGAEAVSRPVGPGGEAAMTARRQSV